MQATYVHTNVIAKDWRSLSAFYIDVFGCELVPPERDYAGSELEGGTALPGIGLQGVHVRLPGAGPNGPTLEIFQYAEQTPRSPDAVNRPGFTHLAFAVDDVPAARAEVLAAGGSAVGEVVVVEKPDGQRVEWCYVRDPEGNMIELQTNV